MSFIKSTELNRKHYRRGSAPTKKQWFNAVNEGKVNGSILDGDVWVDENDFLSRPNLDQAPERISSDKGQVIDLIGGQYG